MAHKSDRWEVFLKEQGINLNDLDEETRQLILGLEPGEINAVLGEKNVTGFNVADKTIESKHISFIDNADVLSLYPIQENALLQSDGTTINSVVFHTIKNVGLKPNTRYVFKSNQDEPYDVIRFANLYDSDGVKTREIENVDMIDTTENEVTISLSLRQEITKFELKDIEVEHDKLNNLSIDADFLINTENKFGVNDVNFISNPKNILENIRPSLNKYVYADGIVIPSDVYNSYMDVPVTPNTTYEIESTDTSLGIRSVAFRDSNGLLTRWVENLKSSFTTSDNEVSISVSIFHTNTVAIFNSKENKNVLENVKIKETDILYNGQGNTINQSSFYGKGRIPLVTFILDGEYDQNSMIEQVFHEHDVRIGFAPQYNTDFPNNSVETYLEWQEKGHEILAHGAYRLTDNSEYTYEEAFGIVKESYNVLSNKGFRINGFIGTSGQVAERYMPAVRKFYNYASTQPNVSQEEIPYVTFNNTPPYKLFRYSMEVSTLEQMKNAVDQTIENNGLLVFYGHAASEREGNLTTENVSNLLTYIKETGTEIMTPYNAIKDYYSIRYEDVIG